MKTQLEYLQNPYKYSSDATILAQGRDESGSFLILDRTIFYPQGGGQPSDVGRVQIDQSTLAVLKVKWVDDTVRHYIHQDPGGCIGKAVLMSIDQGLRQFHSKLHSSGHLISHMIEAKHPVWKATKGHHFPDQCYVEFTVQHDGQADVIATESLNEDIQHCVKASLATNTKEVSGAELNDLCPGLTFSVPKDQPVRVMRIGDFPFAPCGGTHVGNTRDLAGLEVSKIKTKGNVMKVYYEIKF